MFPKQINIKQNRQKILSQVQKFAKKPRFGLFSQPPPIALADNSYFTSKTNRGEDGKPKTKPRNMLAGMNRTGIGKRAFISYPQSIYQKDPFKIEILYDGKIRGKSAIHQNAFKPASGTKKLTNSLYIHLEQKQSRQRKRINRDENGKVRTEPSNILTSPISKIQFKLFRHVAYEGRIQQATIAFKRGERNLEKQDQIRNDAQVNNSRRKLFQKERTQYGLDDKSKMVISQRKPFRFGSYKRVKHEVKFKLARGGHVDPIGRYPEFMNSSSRTHTENSQIRREKTEKSQGQKEHWRPSTGQFSRPSPSICLINMRRNISRA